jgi:hypothetical protein
MQQLQQAVTLNTQDVARKQKILDSADPALIEAGKQALDMLQGKQAASLAPLQNQRAQQRAALEQNLQKQLGSDYATSTAGIQALNNFDQQTSNLSTQLQQSTLSQFMGYVGMGEQAGNMQNNIGNAAGLSAQRGAINQRQVNALLGTNVDPGLQFTGSMARANASQAFQQQQFNQFGNPASASQRGENLVGQFLGGGGGKAMMAAL